MHRPKHQGLLFFLLIAQAMTGCVEHDAEDNAEDDTPMNPQDGFSQATHAQLKLYFKQAEQQYAVPHELLEASAYARTHWNMITPSSEDHHHGQDPAYGVMALGGERLDQAVEFSGSSPQAVKFDARSNILAAAAWFSHRADALAIDRNASLGAWAPVVADFAGLKDDQERWSYVDKEVFSALRRGIPGQRFSSHEEKDPQPLIRAIPGLKAQLPRPQFACAFGPDYSDAIWKPSGNHSARPAGKKGRPQMIIIHSCEGTYGGCTSWLRNKKSKVSAHYVVNSNGSEISQLVDHKRKAWHIGATYQCSLNAKALCELDGVQSNGFTVGIEHAGYASQKHWDPGLIDASAKLTCAIAKKHKIPRDAQHIVGHGQLQRNRSDPGKHWPWTRYLEKVRQYCDDEVSNATIVVDNNNANNDTKRAKASASRNWQGSSATSGHWATDYHFANTLDKSDGFEFAFYLDQDETRSLEAWWTAGSNRSKRAPFVVFNAQGERLDTVHVDQSTKGRRWNHLGRFHFTRGWNRVLLSRWTNSPKVVIADAIRLRPR